MSLCDSSCKACIYSTYMSTWGYACNYILVTGHSRDCDAGKGCCRRIVGRRIDTIDEIIYKSQEKKIRTPEQIAEEKEKKNAWRRAWYARNRDRINAQRREWKQKRKEEKQREVLGLPNENAMRGQQTAV